MSDLHLQSLSDTVRQIKSGERRSVDVTRQILDRIEDIEPTLHAYAMVLGESALETAAQLDQRRQDGGELGALHGVPIAIKDLLFTEGIVTASGTRVMADFVPDRSATVVERLVSAGAVIVGKTQLTEGAFGAHHPDIVAPRNPYDVSYWPGVSSSGSGVAVAAGLAYGALGTDTGGSIRFPSASCGLVGIKPTYGRVSRYGAFALAESLDHIGPMTRTVEDAARMLGVIAGVDAQDPTSLADPVPNYLAGNAKPADVAIGVDWQYASHGVDATVVGVLQSAVAQLSALGYTVVEIELPGEHVQLAEQWGVTCGVECARAHAEYFPQQKDLYGPLLRRLIELGSAVPQSQYDELQNLRAKFRDKFNGLLTQVDMLIAPCMIGPVPTVAQMDITSNSDNIEPFIKFTAPFDYSGHPTLTLPAGVDSKGLPQSFQLVGRLLGEQALIEVGLAYEAATPAMPNPVLPV